MILQAESLMMGLESGHQTGYEKLKTNQWPNTLNAGGVTSNNIHLGELKVPSTFLNRTPGSGRRERITLAHVGWKNTAASTRKDVALHGEEELLSEIYCSIREHGSMHSLFRDGKGNFEPTTVM